MQNWKLISAAVILAATVLFPICSARSENDIGDDLKRYVQIVLGENSVPSLEEYYRFEGESSELELEFVLRECFRRGWIPVITDVNCLLYQRRREESRSETPSLYLKWVRTKLTIAPEEVRILEISEHRERGRLPYDLIRVRLDSQEVVFWRVVGENKQAFGNFSLSEVAGAPVSEMLKVEFNTR